MYSNTEILCWAALQKINFGRLQKSLTNRILIEAEALTVRGRTCKIPIGNGSKLVRHSQNY